MLTRRQVLKGGAALAVSGLWLGGVGVPIYQVPTLANDIHSCTRFCARVCARFLLNPAAFGACMFGCIVTWEYIVSTP